MKPQQYSLVLISALCIACGAPLEKKEEPACHIKFRPVPELMEAAQLAADRLREASGCEAEFVDKKGAQILYSESVVDEDGKEACGITYARASTGRVSLIDISSNEETGCEGRLDDTIAHELIHAFIGKPTEHAESGVFALHNNANMVFNESSLTVLCTYALCSTFNVEADRLP